MSRVNLKRVAALLPRESPLSHHRRRSHDRLVSAGSGGDEAGFDPGQRFKPFHIRPAPRRKTAVVRATTLAILLRMASAVPTCCGYSSIGALLRTIALSSLTILA